MNLATFLHRLLQMGFQPQRVRPQGQATPVALQERKTMTRHAIMTLKNSRLQLRVLRGWVWITRDNCPADMLLGAGDVFEQQPGARVLVQALDEVELLIAGAGGRAHNV